MEDLSTEVVRKLSTAAELSPLITLCDTEGAILQQIPTMYPLMCVLLSSRSRVHGLLIVAP